MVRNLSDGIASLSKKAEELSIVCNVIVALIIFSPGETIPIVWPDHDRVMASVLWHYDHLEVERFRSLVTCEKCLYSKLADRRKAIRKIEQKNEEKKMEIMFNQLFEGKINVNELDAGEIKGLLKLSALTRSKLDERKTQLSQKTQISQSELTTEKYEVDQINDLHAVGGSTSLVDGSSASHGPIERRDE